ncbi:MAG: NADPH:quinone oxidoreductase family protein [Rubrivivax sp.]
MRALRVHGYGPGDGIVLDEMPLPAPGAGQLRLRVQACGISFVDLLLARGGYQLRPEPPFVPGSEFCGVVDAIGPGTATPLQVGDLVCGTRQGAWAEHLCIDAGRAHRVGAGTPAAEAAVLVAPFATALYALRERGHARAGDTVLVLGAGGGVGHAAVQMARQLGVRVIAAASDAAKRAAAQAAGADALVDSAQPDWKDAVKALAGPRGVDLVFDTVGGDTTDAAFRTLGWGGRHLMVGFAGGRIGALKTNLAIVKGAALVGVDFRQAGERDPAAAAALREEVVALHAQGRIRPLLHRVLPVERFAEAAALAQDRATIGRVVFTF